MAAGVKADADLDASEIGRLAVGRVGRDEDPDTHTEYALPHIFPWFAVAAAVAQWQAPDTEQVRPSSMSSSAPLRTGIGAASAGATAPAPSALLAAKPAASNT